MIEQVQNNAPVILNALEVMAEKHDCISAVRGHGYMFAVDCVTPEYCQAILKVAEASGILMARGGVDGQTLRILPPLNTPLDTLIDAVHTLDRIIEHS